MNTSIYRCMCSSSFLHKITCALGLEHATKCQGKTKEKNCHFVVQDRILVLGTGTTAGLYETGGGLCCCSPYSPLEVEEAEGGGGGVEKGGSVGERVAALTLGAHLRRRTAVQEEMHNLFFRRKICW